MKVKCKDTGEIATSYSEYLTTQHWKNLKITAFIKSGGKCQCCRRPLANNFVGHHVNDDAYERIGKERINQEKIFNLFGLKIEYNKDDIIAVCHHCHNGTSENHKKLHEHIEVPKWAKFRDKK